MVSIEIAIVSDRTVRPVSPALCEVSTLSGRCNRATEYGYSLPGRMAPTCDAHLAVGASGGALAFHSEEAR